MKKLLLKLKESRFICRKIEQMKKWVMDRLAWLVLITMVGVCINLVLVMYGIMHADRQRGILKNNQEKVLLNQDTLKENTVDSLINIIEKRLNDAEDTAIKR